MTSVVVYRLFKTMNRKRRRRFPFETELVGRCSKRGLEDDMHSVFENFTDDRGDSYPPIIVHISFVSIPIFDDWYNGATLKLIWHKAMHQHSIEKAF